MHARRNYVLYNIIEYPGDDLYSERFSDYAVFAIDRTLTELTEDGLFV